MVKITRRSANPNDYIFDEGVTISSHQKNTNISKARKIAEKMHAKQTEN